MRILYGILASGRGHISRAEAIVPYLRAKGADVTCLISGYAPGKTGNHDAFQPCTVNRGLRYEAVDGKVSSLKTIFNNNAVVFAKEVMSLDLKSYDVVLTDMEPVTAWAAAWQGKPSVGLAHQYAFYRDVPKAQEGIDTGFITRIVAPVKYSLGFHYHHFGQAGIVPPIVPQINAAPTVEQNKILVYLQYESTEHAKTLLKAHPDYHFCIYNSSIESIAFEDNLTLNPISKSAFLNDLQTCNGVITNAGFMLSSEAVQMGKKLLVKPMDGKQEQASNALALSQMGLAHVMTSLSADTIKHWLSSEQPFSIAYPDVAKNIADWVLNGRWEDSTSLTKDLWTHTEYRGSVPNFLLNYS